MLRREQRMPGGHRLVMGRRWTPTTLIFVLSLCLMEATHAIVDEGCISV